MNTRAFEITCVRLDDDNQPVTYVETVTTYPHAVSIGPNRYFASSPLWGEMKLGDHYPDPRTAALQLAYSKAASVRNIAEVIPTETGA